jgi:hypothetical protein
MNSFLWLAALALASAVDIVPAAAQTASTPPNSNIVEHASADDCAVIIEIGKAKMNWGFHPPEFDFFDTFAKKDSGAYHEDCHWSDFGVASPVIGTPNSKKGFYVSRPVYSGAQASAVIEWTILPENANTSVGPDGQRGNSPFIERDTCTLEKRDGRWHLIQCRLDVIT